MTSYLRVHNGVEFYYLLNFINLTYADILPIIYFNTNMNYGPILFIFLCLFYFFVQPFILGYLVPYMSGFNCFGQYPGMGLEVKSRTLFQFFVSFLKFIELFPLNSSYYLGLVFAL